MCRLFVPATPLKRLGRSWWNFVCVIYVQWGCDSAKKKFRFREKKISRFFFHGFFFWAERRSKGADRRVPSKIEFLARKFKLSFCLKILKEINFWTFFGRYRIVCSVIYNTPCSFVLFCVSVWRSIRLGSSAQDPARPECEPPRQQCTSICCIGQHKNFQFWHGLGHLHHSLGPESQQIENGQCELGPKTWNESILEIRL